MRLVPLLVRDVVRDKGGHRFRCSKPREVMTGTTLRPVTGGFVAGAVVGVKRILLMPATSRVLEPNCTVGLAFIVPMVLGGHGAVGLVPFMMHTVSPISIGQLPSASMCNLGLIHRNSSGDSLFALQMALQVSPPTTV